MMELIKKLCEMIGVGMMDVKKVLVDVEGNEDKVIVLLCECGIVKVVKKGDCEVKEGIVCFVVDGNCVVMVEVNSEIDFVVCNVDFQVIVEKFVQVVFQVKINDVEEFKNFIVDGEIVGNMVVVIVGKIGENIVLNCVVYFEGQQVVGYVYFNGKIGVLVDFVGGDEVKVKDVVLYVVVECFQFLICDEVELGDIEKECEILINKVFVEGKLQQIVEKIVEGQIGKFYQECVLFEQIFVKDNFLIVVKYFGDVLVNKFVCFEIGV